MNSFPPGREQNNLPFLRICSNPRAVFVRCYSSTFSFLLGKTVSHSRIDRYFSKPLAYLEEPEICMVKETLPTNLQFVPPVWRNFLAALYLRQDINNHTKKTKADLTGLDISIA